MTSGLARDRGAGGGRRNEPPNLASYGREPRYDAATVLQRIDVRPMILYQWEQNLGVPAPVRVPDEVGGAMRRYSEQDLVAAMWLRDQILSGETPDRAVVRLRDANPDYFPDTPRGEGDHSGDPRLGRGRVFTGPLPDNTLAPRQTRGSAPATSGELRRPAPVTSGPLGYGQAASGRSQPPAPPERGPAAYSQPQPQRSPAVTRWLGADPNAAMWQQMASAAIGVTSGPLPPPPGVAPSPPAAAFPPASVRLGPATSTPIGGGVPWQGPGAGTTTPREFRPLLPALLQAFVSMDTHAANGVMAEALASARPVESVCVNLLQPALTRITELYGRREMTSPEHHFALNYVRGVLFAFFQKAPERFDAPLVIVGCGQRDLDDTASLMLAVFWRRVGLRVVFLGQDVDSADLVAEVRQRRPALVAITIAASPRMRALARLAKEINQLESPRPIFAYGGPVFVRHPELQRKVTGVYLGDDANTATWHVRNLLGVDHGGLS